MSDQLCEPGQTDHESESTDIWQAELLYLAADIKPYNPVGAERLRQLAARLSNRAAALAVDEKSAASGAAAQTAEVTLPLVH